MRKFQTVSGALLIGTVVATSAYANNKFGNSVINYSDLIERSVIKPAAQVYNRDVSVCVITTGSNVKVKRPHEKYDCQMSAMDSNMNKLICTDSFSAYIYQFIKDQSGWHIVYYPPTPEKVFCPAQGKVTLHLADDPEENQAALKLYEACGGK